MNFALIGDDPVVQPVVRAIGEHPQHRLRRAAFLGKQEAEILLLSPATQIVSGWDELLTGELDAVIVCGAAEIIGEPAKQLAAAGRPLVVFPQGAWDTELIYELSLLRDDTGVKLLPVVPLLEHPQFEDFPRRPPHNEPGPSEPQSNSTVILHLRLERDLQVAAGEELTAETIRQCLLADVGLLRRLGGEYHQVTAVQSATPTGGVVMGTVTLTGENLPDAIWTIRPVSSASRWQLTITRAEGVSVYERQGDEGNIKPVEDAEPPPFDGGQAALEFIERGLSAEAVRPDWTDLTRDFEVLDAVRRSLGRRRTIDLHFETTSERSLFKTQMTAIGCAVLLFTMLALITVLFLGSVLDPRGRVETTANNAETIFRADAFQPGSAQLTLEGEAHWDRVASARRDPAIPILVEQTDNENLDIRRRDRLVARLEEEGITNPDQRVEVYDLEGPWFEALMKIARVLVFLPLFVFLGLQSLLLITRTSHSHRKSEKSL